MLNKALYELTNPQKSIWLVDQLSSDPINNITGVMYLDLNINIPLLINAVNLTVKENDALRTRLVLQENSVKQYFCEFKPFDIDVLDFSKNSLEDFNKEIKNFSEKIFNLIDTNLFEFLIIKTPKNNIALIGKFHHIISDAWSLGLIIDNIADNYCSLNNNKLVKNNVSYLEFIKKDENYVNSENFIKNKNFWKHTLSSFSPINIKTSINNSKKATRYSKQLSRNLTNEINLFCKDNNISPYVFFLSILDIYLYKTTSQSKFSIGTPVLNRFGTEKNIIGMFVNMISICLENKHNCSYKDLLKKLSIDSFSFFKNSRYPYINTLSDSKNIISESKAYSFVYSFQNMRPNSKVDLDYYVDWLFAGYQQDDLIINITDINNNGTYSIVIDYLISLFSDVEIDYIFNRLISIINIVISNPSIKIEDIDILFNNEKNDILNSFNNTLKTYDKTKTLIDLFDETVLKYPSNTALVYKNNSLSYIELNKMVNIVYSQIVKLNIYNEKIAILCDKSFFMIAGLLAIMKSGNSYIPIDPSYPLERINYIIENSSAKLLLTTTSYKDNYSFDNKIILDTINYKIKTYENYRSKATLDMLAYTIYTSGTTGAPKGVKIKHSNIINTLLWRKRFYNFDATFSVIQIPSFSFDSSVEDIFTPLISGAKLVLPSSKKMDINTLCTDISKNNVNHFLVVPSLYKILLHEKSSILNDFKVITIAGENFSSALINEHFSKLPNVRLINEYGPTENSVCSTFYELSSNDSTVLIGKPIDNCKCYVLDSHQKLLPLGIAGELYVSGPGVSDGYLNNPDMTKNRFVDNPFDKNYKMYKTGDIVRLNFDMNLEFFGRDDNQIKLNGFRIELKEIESVILETNYVDDVLVTTKALPDSKKILLAYILSSNQAFDINILNSFLRKRLPYYMIPTILLIDKFPLTPNGKVDNKKLPLPKSIKAKHVIPKNKLEKEILETCKSVLHIEKFGTSDDFFIDGHADSLSILSISSKLFTKNIKIKTQDFYDFSSVEKLSKYILSKKSKVAVIDKKIIKPYKTSLCRDYNKNHTFSFSYKNILLTGATGFLGIHILDYLLKNTSADIYCIIRKKYNQSPKKRLKNIISYYFDKDYFNTYNKRIFIINGDLLFENFKTSNKDYLLLKNKIDCIINAAANTKHYGNYKTFYNENFVTVKNLVCFAEENRILFNQISTTSVSGDYNSNSKNNLLFTENDLYIGQDYKSNVYIRSKFEAEKFILKEERNGLIANIFRVGNLMARYSDGVFQRKKLNNLFYTRLLTIAKTGFIPDYLKEQALEFSPVDNVAEAIIKLLYLKNSKNKIFHIYTDKLINFNMLLNVFSNFGITCNYSNYETFIKTLNLKENEKFFKYLVSDLTNNLNYIPNIQVKNDITNSYLKTLGFNWNIIDEAYLYNFFTKSDFTKDII